MKMRRREQIQQAICVIKRDFLPGRSPKQRKAPLILNKITTEETK